GLPLCINIPLLVMFGAPWNKQGRWMHSGTEVSGCKNKDIHFLLTSCAYQGSHNQVIEEGNLHFSRWISNVASTGCKQLRKPAPVKQKNTLFIWFIEGNDRIEGNIHAR